MERFCYVSINNPRVYSAYNKGYEKTEVGKVIEKYTVERSTGYYQPCATALSSIYLQPKEREEKGFFGTMRKVRYYEKADFLIICENKGDYLQDVVSGKTFRKQKDNIYTSTTYQNGLILCAVSSIPINEVANRLRTLNDNDVERIKKAMNALDKEIAIAHQVDEAVRQKDKTARQNDITYVKNFRNKYGK